MEYVPVPTTQISLGQYLQTVVHTSVKNIKVQNLELKRIKNVYLWESFLFVFRFST